MGKLIKIRYRCKHYSIGTNFMWCPIRTARKICIRRTLKKEKYFTKIIVRGRKNRTISRPNLHGAQFITRNGYCSVVLVNLPIEVIGDEILSKLGKSPVGIQKNYVML